MKSTIVFIDGGYLSFISKHFGGGKPLKYKIEKFAVNITKEIGLNCQMIYFYIAPPFQSPKPSKEENIRKANYDKFIEKLKFVRPRINIREGRLQKIPIIKDIRKTYGVEVILAYFTDRKRKSAFSLSNHLWKAVDKRILIKRKHFEN